MINNIRRVWEAFGIIKLKKTFKRNETSQGKNKKREEMCLLCELNI